MGEALMSCYTVSRCGIILLGNLWDMTENCAGHVSSHQPPGAPEYLSYD